MLFTQLNAQLNIKNQNSLFHTPFLPMNGYEYECFTFKIFKIALNSLKYFNDLYQKIILLNN